MSEQGPLSGQVLGGKYRLGALLGQGGFGAVYQAENQILQRPQAIKVLLEERFSDARFLSAFCARRARWVRWITPILCMSMIWVRRVI